MYKGEIKYSPDFLSNLAIGAGYDSNSAVAELIDNSIGSKAEVIKITAKNGRFKIEDFGENSGMDEKTLTRNFFYGGNSSTREDECAAGKFGVGGKTGILTIIGDIDANVEIVTHKSGFKPIYAVWSVKRGRTDSYEYDFLKDESIPFGTTIEFNYTKEISVEELVKFIGVVYCWAINNGTKIYVNNIQVMANDPLYRYNENVKEYGLFSSKTFSIKNGSVVINSTAFNCGNIIPEEELHSWDKGNGKTKSVLTANRSGIYLRTDGRYYTLGGNFDKIMGGTAHASLDGLRIEVCIPKSLWNEIGITWNKGKEVVPFTKIDIFNADNGVCEYISSLMCNFKNGKETSDEKSASKINKAVCEFISENNVDSINAVIIASNNKGNFVEYKDSTLTFDISKTSMCRKEILGIVKAVVISVDSIIKGYGEDVINNIINRLNS